MSLLDRARERLQPKAQGQRAFVTGPSVVQQADVAWGVSPEKFSPEAYGDYLATSNSVYAIIQQRSDLLSALPLKLYRFGKNVRQRHNRQQLGLHRQRTIARLSQVYHKPALFQRSVKQENLDEITEGMLVELLAKVNPYWTLQRLIKMTEMSLGVWGRNFWFMERGRSGRGTPKEIWWAKSAWVRPVPDPTNYISGFIFEPNMGMERIEFTPSETIWLNYPNPLDEFNPLSPVAASRIYADHENASMQANLNLHKQGLQIGGIVSPGEGVTWSQSQAEEVEQDMMRRFRGVSKAHRWGAFRHKVDIKEVGVTPEDAQFLEGMNWDLEAVARAYRWPLDLIGGRRTYKNVDAATVGAYVFSVLPEAAFIASELTEQLLPMFPGEADLIWFDASEVHVLQEAENERWTREMGQITTGAITVNQWRQLKGMEPVPWGDVWWAPANLLPVGDGQPPQAPAQGEQSPPRFYIVMPQRSDSPVFVPAGGLGQSNPAEKQIATLAESSQAKDATYWDGQFPEYAGLLEAEVVDL